MADRTITLEFGPEDRLLSREEFRKKFRQEFRKPLTDPLTHWAYQLANVFGEVVKNFYDHANGQGKLSVIVCGNVIEWEAADAGPGDPEERSIDELIAYAFTHPEKYASPTPNGNAGLGLAMMKGGLDGIVGCTDVKESTWSLSTKGRFVYRGVIVLA
jgi:hypothetical protein